MRLTIMVITILILALSYGVQGERNIVGQSFSFANDNISTDLAIPKNMNFQGILYQSGSPVTDTMDMWFGIYNALSGGTLLYSVTNTDVAVIGGWFSTMLTNIPNSVFPVTGPTRYLEIKAPATGPALSPRLELASVGYAYHAITADTAEYTKSSPISRPITPPISGTEIAKPCTLKASVTSPNAVLQVKNTGTGDGIRVDSAGGDGVNVVRSWTGVHIENAGHDAVAVASAGGAGLAVGSANYGVWVNNAADRGVAIHRAYDGVLVDSAAWVGLGVGRVGAAGLWVGNSDWAGVIIDSAADRGVHINRAGVDGVVVQRAGGDGVYVDSAANCGFYVNQADTGLKVQDARNGIYVGSSTYQGILVESANRAAGIEVRRAGGFGPFICDGLRIDYAKNNGVNVDTAGDVGFKVVNCDTGLKVWRAKYDGVYIDSAGDNGVDVNYAGDNGIYVNRAHSGAYIDRVNGNGVHIDSAGDNGIYVGSAANHGVLVDSAFTCGVRINRAGQGVFVRNAEWAGLNIDTADLYGVYIAGARCGISIDSVYVDGIYINKARDNGIRISHANDCGILVDDARFGIMADGWDYGGSFYAGSSGGCGLDANSWEGSALNRGLECWGWAVSNGGWFTILGDKKAPCILSLERSVIASGTGKLSNGKSEINFEPAIQENIRTDIPIKITVTPKGKPAGFLYVSESKTTGFKVELEPIPGLEKNATDVTFDWIACATLKEPETSPEAKAKWEKMMQEREERRTKNEIRKKENEARRKEMEKRR